ncbi:50S ribosome-binding GTPase [Candidatus Shapirobacteria bacterium]|nr:50S ribosome-binding GTPase [Candidatus Shapirobacteria bacterium]
MIAEEISKKIEAVEKEIRDTPYDKSSQFHHGVLKAKLSKLRDMLEVKNSSGGGGVGYAIKHSGDASVVLVGLPSVGKSTLLNAITNAESKVGNYDFTTLGVIPGMMEYKGINIQILDLPGIIEGAATGKGFGRKVLSVVRASDLVILMADVDRINWIGKIKNEMEQAGVRPNQEPPKIIINRVTKGGLRILDPFNVLPMDQMETIALEMGYESALIQLVEKIETVDRFIDGLSKSRTYIPLLEIVTKIDTVKNLQSSNFKLQKKEDRLYMSVDKGIGVEEFKEAVWRKLGLVRVYLKRERTGEPDKKEPLIMHRGQNLRDVLNKISTQMSEDVARGFVWGKGARFPGQEVSFKYEVWDEMEVWFGR